MGLVFVVSSLIYVGLEIRQNAKATRAATMNNVLTHWGAAYRFLGASKNVGELVWTGVQNPNALSGAARWRFSTLVASVFHHFQNAHYQSELGVYDEDSWAAQSHYLANLMSLPGMRATWDERKEMFSRNFQNFMETQILKTPADENYKFSGT